MKVTLTENDDGMWQVEWDMGTSGGSLPFLSFGHVMDFLDQMMFEPEDDEGQQP